MPKRTADSTYRRNRAIILQGDPLCHWCKKQPATQADHLIEHDRGGTDDVENLVPSCSQCNGRRGQKYKTQRDQATKKRREQAVNTAEQKQTTDFFHNQPLPPAPKQSSFLPNQPELAGTGSDQLESIGIGRELPRLETTWVGGNSYGPAVAAWAEKYLQTTLMPWQVRALSGQLQCDDSGRLRFRESLVTCARQQGKSVALTALIGWWITDYAATVGRPQSVLSTANQLDRAEAIFTTLAPVLVEYFDGKQLAAIGRKSVRVGKSEWVIRAASSRLHGGSYDLIICDELWNIPAAVMDEALRPSQIARPNPLLSCWSTAGDLSSDAMIQMRERALSEIDNGEVSDLYFAEWSMPLGANPKDERWWAYANPSLGTTVTLEALRAASKKESFLRAHLNQWITAKGSMLDPGVWESCEVAAPMPSGGVLAVDSSIDEARYVGTRAVMVDGRCMVTLEFVVNTEEKMWAEVQRVMEDKTTLLAVTPTLEVHLPMNLNRRFTVVGYGELLRYTSLVKAMIMEEQVCWPKGANQMLSEHMNRAVAVKTAQGLVLSSQKSPGPIEIARTAIWAIAKVSKPVNKSKPVLVVSG